MAGHGVWGIDIGQCALKALRCQLREDDPSRLEATHCEYIEFPMHLAQAGTNVTTLIADALNILAARNSLRGDRVVVAASGNSGLVRFIKLPPVEATKIPDIVKYEARQQIPYPLDDVVWDYQVMAGGCMEDGFAIDSEVGIFAMKRDQVSKLLDPFQMAGIEVDCIQLTPLALYNVAACDQMPDSLLGAETDLEKSPKSTILISIGTNTIDLVIINGHRVWQRSLQLGASHFTKALMKAYKLSYEKAERLKKNIMKSSNPKAVYRTMRPAFSDLVNEIQRSVRYYLTSVERDGGIERAILIGNVIRMPGFINFLAQNLDFPITDIKDYSRLSSEAISDLPSFRSKRDSFATCYGLALQGLGQSVLSTNLLPREIVTRRLIHAKKPWIAATAAALLLGLAINTYGHWRAYSAVAPERFRQAFIAAENVERVTKSQRVEFEAEMKVNQALRKDGEEFLGGSDRRLVWAEMLKAIDACLPSDSPKSTVTEMWQRNELHIDQISCEWYEELEDWFTTQHIGNKLAELERDIAGSRDSQRRPAAKLQSGQRASSRPGTTPGPGSKASPPTGAGWVISLKGHHYHNDRRQTVQGYQFVRDTLIANLREQFVDLPGREGSHSKISMEELGVSHVVLTSNLKGYVKDVVNDRLSGESIELSRFDFEVQYAWCERPMASRIDVAAASMNESVTRMAVDTTRNQELPSW